MAEWSVRFEVTSSKPWFFTEEKVETLIEALEDFAPAISYTDYTLAVRFAVETKAPQPESAVNLAFKQFSKAMERAHLNYPGTKLVGAELQLMDDFNRRIVESNAPDLIGVAELAAILNVSKQRASELARSDDFPQPIAHLASGPVWRTSTILRYVSRWKRQPGRPRKTPAEALRS